MAEKYAPYTDEPLYSTRPEAVHAIREILGSYAGDFDVDAIADELVEWHACYIERDGETVEWLPGNGFYIQQFADDAERGDAESFWELVASHDVSGDEGYVDFVEKEIQQGELAADARYSTV